MAALESLSKEIATLQASLQSLRDGPINDKLDKVLWRSDDAHRAFQSAISVLGVLISPLSIAAHGADRARERSHQGGEHEGAACHAVSSEGRETERRGGIRFDLPVQHRFPIATSSRSHAGGAVLLQVIDSNPYSRLMALQRMGIVDEYEKIRQKTVAIVVRGRAPPCGSSPRPG